MKTLRPLAFLASCFAAVLAVAALATSARAQDSRGTIAEPTFPTVCTQVQADLTISGGEPSSELNTATDTTNIQNALKNCASGQAVELVANGANNAFVIAPIYIPAGVTLLVDGGVTVFGSKNAADYQIGTAGSGNTCGSADSGSACNPLITLGQSSVNGSSTTNYSGSNPITGLMGYGVINGRGGDKYITISGSTVTTTSSSAWDYALTGNEDVPVLIYSYKTPNVTLYKITLLNSPHFHVRITGQGGNSSTTKETNFTVWGLKLLTPFSAKNTDGIDPTGTYNVSILNSIIGDGDDESAISGSSLSLDFTYQNLLLTSGHGLSIGSITTKNVSNVSYSNVNFSGQATDPNQIALRIKSYCGNGGTVSAITYNGVCVQNVAANIDLDPFYSSTSSTSSCPIFGTSSAPITYENIYFTTNGRINLQGYNNSTNLSYVALNNVYSATALNLAVNQSADTTATPANDNITLTGGYYPSTWGTLNTATNATSVTETNSGTPASSFPTTYCANAFPTLEGELYANITSSGTTTSNINRATTVTLPATITLNGFILPTNTTTSYNGSTAAAVPTAVVNFFDGATQVGTGTLGTNGTLASATITNPAAGTHTYTIQYAGDSNYAAQSFGTATYTGTQNGPIPTPTALSITVNAGPASQLAFSNAPASSITYGSGPGTVTVIGEDVAGDQLTTLSGTVTLTVTGPNSYSKSYTATASSGTATFSGISNPPSTGSYTYTASQTSLTSAAANETVTQATLNVTANAASRLFDRPNPTFTYGITGYQNSDPSSVVTGIPTLTTTAVPVSTAGAYPITTGVGTLSAINYTFSTTGNTLTVNGNTPQQITFYPLPNFPHGNSYQLTASSSSGLPVTYTVSGNATITNGSTLNVTGTGQITVTAAQSGNSNYAAASNVQQSFTAQ